MSDKKSNESLRRLPAMHKILNAEKGRELTEQYGRQLVVTAVDEVLDEVRKSLLSLEKKEKTGASLDMVLDRVENHLAGLAQTSLRRVINATGVLLHTNMGRAVLSKNAQEALLVAASGYTNLEYDLERGERGSRYEHVEKLLLRLTKAESALVVNNNAGAVLLAINTLAKGKEAIVSRGELVEIGGSFRVPEVMKLGGAKLVEVGTTNRTHLADYKQAISDDTAAILKVHTSNFRIVGFSKSVERKELLELAHSKELPLIEDLGSGSFLDFSQEEATVFEVIATGVDVVTFSGDKLLGGPQAGILLGKKEYIEAMKKNQLARALRVDKFTLAALEATLLEYLSPEKAMENVPLYRMLNAPVEMLREKAEAIATEVNRGRERIKVIPIPTKAQMGGGSIPGQEFPSYGLDISCEGKSPMELEGHFRSLPIPIIGYIERERYIMDLRTVLPGEEEVIINGIRLAGG